MWLCSAKTGRSRACWERGRPARFLVALFRQNQVAPSRWLCFAKILLIQDLAIMLYGFIPYDIKDFFRRHPVPRAHSDSGRVELRLRPEDKAVLTRAATLERLDLTGFILRNVLPQAAAVIAREERLRLSERDSLRVLELLENPPAAPARLVRAAKAGFTLE
jgi:uncharacterized protein (DUF1778 family)